MSVLVIRFSRYEIEDDHAPGGDLEYAWRIRKLRDIVSDKSIEQIDCDELVKYHDCLYELREEDFYKMFVALIKWYGSACDVYDLFIVLISRMGFAWRRVDIDFGQERSALGYVASLRPMMKREGKVVRDSVVAAFPIFFVQDICRNFVEWSGFLSAHDEDYICRVFLRWSRLAIRGPGAVKRTV